MITEEFFEILWYIYIYIYIYTYLCLSLRDYISLDFIRLHQTLMPMTLVIDSYIISTTLILNALLFPSHLYSSVPKILHLSVKFFEMFLLSPVCCYSVLNASKLITINC